MCSGLCHTVVSGIFFQFVLFLACVTVILDRVTGFKSPDRERFTALFTSSISFPDREETRTWTGNNFLVAECARGCYVLHNA